MQTSEVPDDIWQEVFSFLPYRDLISASLTNKRMLEVTLPLQQRAIDSLILTTLHFEPRLAQALLKDANKHLIFWKMSNDSEISVEAYKMKNIRDALNTICFDIRIQLYADGFYNMVHEWKNTSPKTKKQKLCCSTLNCTEQPLPTGRCEKHTKDLLNNSDVYVIQFFEKYLIEYTSGTSIYVTIAQKTSWQKTLLEMILGTESERAGNEYTDIDWNPGFKAYNLEFLYGFFFKSIYGRPEESFGLFFAELEDSFDQSKEYEKDNVLL